MPPIPRFRTSAIRELIRELRFAPAETRRRQMDAAEQLVDEIEPGRDYPQEFIVFKLTGYRSDATTDPVMLAGDRVRPDLVAVVQHLSRTVALPPDYRGRAPLTLETVCDRLNVSARTLQRYRREGLVCHYVTATEGDRRLVCFEDALERFRRGQTGRLGRAASFDRIPDPQRRLMIEEARTAARGGLSLNEAARRIARRHQRAHETVRRALRNHERDAASPLFADTPRLTPRQRRVLHRAWRFGIAPAELARRFGKSAPAVHRAINLVRRELLAGLTLSWVELPTFERAEAEQVILSAPAVVGELDDDRLDTDAVALIAAAHGAAPVPVDLEDGLIAAYNLLKKRARAAIAGLPRAAGDAELDPVETDLRWARLIKRRLIGLSFPFALRAIEQNLHRRLDELPGDSIVRGVHDALDLIADAIETLDPGRGQRLERLVTFAMDRALAARPDPPARAAARHPAGRVRLDPRGLAFTPWGWLVPRDDLRRLRRTLPADARRLVSLRYGWDGTPPLTFDAIAEELDLPRRAAGRAVWSVESGLRARARGRVDPS